MRVSGGNISFHGKRAGRSLHAVCRINIILEQNRDTVERPPDFPRPPLFIQYFCDGDGFGIQFNDSIQKWSGFVNLVDPGNLGLCELYC